MPFFSREEPPTSTPAVSGGDSEVSARRTAPGPARGSRIAAGIVVHGRVTGTEPVRVDGTVEGDVVVDSEVVVGSGGRVAGRIEARTVLVEGRLEGDLAAAEKAEVAASGSTEGDIEAPRVVIAEGAYFKGNVRMGRPSGAGREGAT